MSRSKKKPKIIVKCVANQHAASDETIIEFTFPNGAGGLISFREQMDRAVVEVYRQDPTVFVLIPRKKE